jgi:hypothetical protein
MPGPTIPFNVANWYWVVAGSSTQVYSSAGVAYVPVGDLVYAAWLASGGLPTPIAVEQDLWDLLTAAGMAIPVTAVTSDAGKTAVVSQIDLVIGKVLFNHENRIRVLEGKAQITAAQFIAGVKALLQ